MTQSKTFRLLSLTLFLATTTLGCASSDEPSDGACTDCPSGDDSCEDCDSGDPNDPSSPSSPSDPLATPCLDCDDLFVTFAEQGQIDFELHPSPATPSGTGTMVAFAIPFPGDVLDDVSSLVITDREGNEIATHVEEINRWWSPSDGSVDRGVRSALVWMNASFSSGQPTLLTARYGASRSAELGAQGNALDTWKAVKGTDYSEALMEPAAYAVLPQGWLSATLVLGRSPAIDEGAMGWFDDFFIGAAHTAVNDVPTEVTQLVDVEGDVATWLFDRAAALYGVYVRTGDFTWLRHAHRAAQFYGDHVNAKGYFDMKDGDLKYSYGQSLVIDLMLTGNTGALAPIERVASAGETWNPVYKRSSNFWTERHQTYSFLAALSAFEATGSADHAQRVNEVFTATRSHVESPGENLPKDGCLAHSFEAHEGVASQEAICSPWMTALLSDALWRYFLVSRDTAALSLMAGFGDYVKNLVLYNGSSENLNRTVPWYIASSERQWSDSGPWADLEHACDVGGMVVRAAWAKRNLGQDASSLSSTITELMDTCHYSVDYWHRPGGLSSGLAEWRLTPARKFQWWFKSNLELSWYLTQNAAP